MYSLFLFNKFKHLRQFYGSDIEFIDHMLNGEVKMSVKDAIEFHDEMVNNELHVNQFMKEINQPIIGVQVVGLKPTESLANEPCYQFACNFSLKGYSTEILQTAIASAIQDVINKPGTNIANNG